MWVAGGHPLEYHANGRLRRFTLAREQWIGGRAYEAGLDVTLDPKGTVLHAKKKAPPKKRT